MGTHNLMASPWLFDSTLAPFVPGQAFPRSNQDSSKSWDECETCKSRIHPMTYYYLGYFAEKLGQAQKAQEYYQKAMAMPSDYVFPFQSEAIGVLRQAIAANPHDARASYYLGNVLYDWQPEEATRMWEA